MYHSVALILTDLAIAAQQNAVDPYAPTADRLWATTAALLALVSVLLGGLALARSTGRIGTGDGRREALAALVAGMIAGVNGGLVLATADGGPGTGNGVVGGGAALVLGLIAIVFSGVTLARPRRTA